jgi:hypothetical protein
LAVTEERLRTFLGRHRKIGLDTNVFIFQIEEHTKYLELVTPIFVWLEGPGAWAVTSTITMLELLVQPYRLSDIDRVNKFYALLSTYPHLEWIAPTLEIADRAARLRADHRLNLSGVFVILSEIKGRDDGANSQRNRITAVLTRMCSCALVARPSSLRC